MHPRAERRKIAVVLVPTRMELRLRTVVAVGGPHRTDDGEPIHISANVGKPITDLDAAFAVLAKTDLQRIKRFALIAIGVGNDQPLDGQFFRIEYVGEWRLGNRLAAILGEHRLRIEAFHVADAAVHEQPDHVLGLRRENAAAPSAESSETSLPYPSR